MAYRLAARLAGPGGGRDRRASRCCSPTSSSATSRAATPRGCSSRSACWRSSATSTAAAATRSCSASSPGCCGPEVWPLWALYGLWLRRRSSGAAGRRGGRSRSSAAPGVLTLVLWFAAGVPRLGLRCCAPPSARASPTRTRPRSPPRRSSRSSAARRRCSPCRSTSGRSSAVVLAVRRRRRAVRAGVVVDARGALDDADGRRGADDRGRLRRQPALRRAARRDGLHPRRRGLGRAGPRCCAGAAGARGGGRARRRGARRLGAVRGGRRARVSTRRWTGSRRRPTSTAPTSRR